MSKASNDNDEIEIDNDLAKRENFETHEVKKESEASITQSQSKKLVSTVQNLKSFDTKIETFSSVLFSVIIENEKRKAKEER